MKETSKVDHKIYHSFVRPSVDGKFMKAVEKALKENGIDAKYKSILEALTIALDDNVINATLEQIIDNIFQSAINTELDEVYSYIRSDVDYIVKDEYKRIIEDLKEREWFKDLSFHDNLKIATELKKQGMEDKAISYILWSLNTNKEMPSDLDQEIKEIKE